MDKNSGKWLVLGLSVASFALTSEVVKAEEDEINTELLLDTIAEENVEVSQEEVLETDLIENEDIEMIEDEFIEEVVSEAQTIASLSINDSKVHTVSSGEYLYAIGQKYGVSVAQIKEWNNLTSNYIYTGDELIVSNPNTTGLPSDDNKPVPEIPANNTYYTVVAGDYLWKIATQYNVTVQQLKEWNQLSSNFIYSGDQLIVSKQEEAEKDKEPKPELPPLIEEDKEEEKPKPSEPSKLEYYTVRSGDYLWKIATQHGISLQQLKSWNNLSSNLIFSGDKLVVTDPSLSNQEDIEDDEVIEDGEEVIEEETTEEEKEEESDKDESLAEAKYHTVKSGEYLWLIAQRYGITVNQLKAWNNLSSNYIYSGDRFIVTDPNSSKPTEDLPTTELSGTHQAVQAVLNQYKNSSVHIFYESLLADDLRTASLNGDSAMYGASVPKVVLVAYTLEQIEKGNLSWDTPLKYNSAIYNHPESYAWGGSGTIQYESYQTKTYTLQDIVYRTIAHSDNLGSNMLLHFVGYRDKEDFNRFTQEVYGAPSYTRNMTPREINKVMRYIYDHPQQYAMKALDKTNYDGTKLDTVAANVYQKIGAWWPYYNHSTAIVDSERPYILTILTDYWSDSAIANIAKKIFNAVMS